MSERSLGSVLSGPDSSADNGPMAPVELATHQWASATNDPTARVAMFVHGVTGWWKTWWRVAPMLAEHGWRVVAVDQRGHGHSPRIDGRVTVADLAEDLGASIRRVGAPLDALIGHSLGAAVAAELGHREPDLVRRLVLEDPPAIERTGDVAWLSNLERELIAADRDFEGEVARELRENATWGREDARQDVEGKQLADRAGIVASFRSGVGARVIDLAPSLRVPTLYLLAAEDRSVFPPEPRRELARRLPAASRITVMDAGHTIHRDRFDAYVSTVLAWLEPDA